MSYKQMDLPVNDIKDILLAESKFRLLLRTMTLDCIDNPDYAIGSYEDDFALARRCKETLKEIVLVLRATTGEIGAYCKMRDLIYSLPNLSSISFHMPLSTTQSLIGRKTMDTVQSKDSDENPDFYPWIIDLFEHHPNPQLVRSIHFRLSPDAKPEVLRNPLGIKWEKLSRILCAVDASPGNTGVTGTSRRRYAELKVKIVMDAFVMDRASLLAGKPVSVDEVRKMISWRGELAGLEEAALLEFIIEGE